MELHDFRNYAQLQVALPAGLIVLEGPNAQGKTALLEALHLLGMARSFRAPSDADLIGWGQPFARVKATLENGRELELRYIKQGQSTRKEVRAMGQPVRKLADFLGELPLALFTPEDLQLVWGAPTERRRYLDVLLCKLYPAYLGALTRYQRCVKERSTLLRRPDVRTAELEPWDEMLVSLGAELTARRERLCEPLAGAVRSLYHELSGEPADLSLRYRPSGSADIATFGDTLRARRGEELRMKTCLVGPHRDELVLGLGGREVRRFGSQGQRRTLALALRLAQARLFGELGGESALVLLDDCFSELDPDRQRRLLAALKDVPQVFITTATPLELEVPCTIFEVQAGTLRKT